MPNTSKTIFFLGKILKPEVLRHTYVQIYQVLPLNLTDAIFISEYSHVNVLSVLLAFTSTF